MSAGVPRKMVALSLSSLLKQSRKFLVFLVFAVLITSLLLLSYTMIWPLQKTLNSGSLRPIKLESTDHHKQSPVRQHTGSPTSQMKNASGLDAWELEQKARHATIQQTCLSRGLTANLTSIPLSNSLKYILVDDVHKVMYCYVPKVGCTSWKTALLALVKGWDKVHKVSNIHDRDFLKSQGLPSLNMMTFPEAQRRLQVYRKFMFVRDPLERQISAYRNKFEGPNEWYFKNKYGRIIVSKYRKHPSAYSQKYATDVTYPEFVRFMTEGYRDLHWIPQTDLCNPCAIHFDYIGKYETFGTDVQHILAILFNKTSNVTNFFPSYNVNKGADTKTSTHNYISQLSSSSLKALMEYYQSDYNMFQYTPHYVNQRRYKRKIQKIN